MTEPIKPEWMNGFVPVPNSPRAAGGRFEKGQSGNPSGRPPGRLDTRTKITRALMDDGHAVARVVIDAALEGDLQACGIVLSRIAPVLRPEAQPVQFDFDPTASTALQVEAVLTAIAAGAVPVDLGKQLIDAIKALADVRATEELERRIITLEARQI
jgi:hypothetical protein